MLNRHCRAAARGACLLLSLVAGLVGCTAGRSAFTIENDLFAIQKSDNNYTQGMAFTHAPDDAQTFEIGHRFYTPKNIELPDPMPKDRPYAGHLWVGHARHHVTPCRDGGALRTQSGFRVGFVGAPSLASELQKLAHKISGSTEPMGWRHQIETEPTIGVHCERKRRFFDFGCGAWRGDAMGLVRADIGTDITRFRIGGTLRFGLNLPGTGLETPKPTSFGQPPIRNRIMDFDRDEFSGGERFLSRSDDLSTAPLPRYGFEKGAPRQIKPRDPLRAYLTLGADAHYTAYNVFIDNHLFRKGTELSLEPIGFDVSAGVMVEWQGFRFGYQHIFRTAEYVGDRTRDVGSIVIGRSFGGS